MAIASRGSLPRLRTICSGRARRFASAAPKDEASRLDGQDGVGIRAVPRAPQAARSSALKPSGCASKGVMSRKTIPGFGKSGTARINERISRSVMGGVGLLQRGWLGDNAAGDMVANRRIPEMNLASVGLSAGVGALNAGGKALRGIGVEAPSLERASLERAARRRARLQGLRRLAHRRAAHASARSLWTRGGTHDARSNHGARTHREPARNAAASGGGTRQIAGNRERIDRGSGVRRRSAAYGHDPAARLAERRSRQPLSADLGSHVPGRIRK